MLNLPSQFIQSVSCCQGFDEQEFINAHQILSPTSIRVNPFKKTELKFRLNDPVLWNTNGFYLEARPNFTHDILFQAGCYYVQEAGSMFIEHALRSCVDLNNTLSVLDVCASPGGKSTLINSLINKESMLVANEVVKQRAEVLAQNLSKWGTSNTIVTNNDPAAFSGMQNVFDVILVDAPCSGSGLFRKQHEAVEEWSLDHVNLCSQRQKRILSDIVGSLKAGGILIYSTCSYSLSENEAIADWIISEHGLISKEIPVHKDWGIIETSSEEHKAFGYRFYPDKTRSEGFFCTVFQKPGQSGNHHQLRKNKQENFISLKLKDKGLFSDWIRDISDHEIIKFKEDYLLTNGSVINFINRYPHLYLKKAGTTIGSMIKESVIPHHDFAWSIYKSDHIPALDCKEPEALRFVKKELQFIEGNKGWNLMSYHGFGIGWIKNLGNRLNNYLPNELRILK